MSESVIAVGATEATPLSSEVFRLNPHPAVRELKVGHGGYRVMVVDDFYLDPEGILPFIDQMSFVADRRRGLALPVSRAVVRLDLRHVRAAVRAYARERRLRDVAEEWFVVQGMWGNAPLKPNQRLPHTDPAIAAYVYLNRPGDCSGGTALYRHRPTGLELIPYTADKHMIQLARDLGYPPLQENQRTRNYVEMIQRMVFHPSQANPDGSMLNDGNHCWELMLLLEMRFNRLIIHDGRIPHTAYLQPGSFEEVPRLMQMLSIEFDESVWPGERA